MKISNFYKGILISLSLHLFLIVFFVPSLHLNLFAPFIQHFTMNLELDPWQSWLDSGGRSDAFPYGPLMLSYFSIFAIILKPIIGIQSAQVALALGILLVEIWVLKLAFNFSANQNVIFFLSFSPILITATYIHGQLDLLPAALLFAGLLYLKNENWGKAGFLLGLSASAKFSALLVLPLIYIFFIRSTRYRKKIFKFTAFLIPGLILTFAPITLSGYRVMVAETPQTSALFSYAINLSSDFSVLLAPVVMALFVTVVIKYKRANLEMLFIFCVIALAAFPLLMPSSPGWFLWGLPGLVLISSKLPQRYKVLVITLSSAQSLNALLTKSSGRFRTSELFTGSTTFFTTERLQVSNLIQNLTQSFTLLLGVFALWQIFKISVENEDSFRFSSKPLSVAVAGDSGTGKDTICASIASVFGEERCAFILGDDYHAYERGASVWGTQTHLNPALNDLDRLTRDSIQILNEKSVWSRHYDHDRGRFTKARKVNNGDIVTISGLHVLSIDSIRKNVDLSVFLDMDNNLRKFLKIERDVTMRNQTLERTLNSLQARELDREQYIQPQAKLADLVIKTKCSKPINLENFANVDLTEIEVISRMRGLTFGSELVKTFTALSGVAATISYEREPGNTVLHFRSTSWITDRDIASVAHKMIHENNKILASEPVWQSGSIGVTQLLIVLALLERRNRNLLKAKI